MSENDVTDSVADLPGHGQGDKELASAPNSPRWRELVESLRSGSRGPYKSLLNSLTLQQDPPDHTRLCKLVAKAFTVRSVQKMRLGKGELAAVAKLEAIYAGAPLVRQIFLYGNGKRPGLLAVIVPAPVAVAEYGNTPALKAALHQLLQQTAALAGLQSHEVPVDFLIETDPFTDENGLLSGVAKQLRSRFRERYGERLEQMYTEIAAARVDETRVLRQTATNRPAVETLARASRALLGSATRPSNPISPNSAEMHCPRCGSAT